MSMLASWVLFPALLALAALGHGLLVQRLAGERLPGTLLLPVGLAAVLVLTQLAVSGPGTAELAVPVVAFVAFVGLAFDRPWRHLRLERPPLVAALGTFG